jgi:hypothetical protein
MRLALVEAALLERTDGAWWPALMATMPRTPAP